MSDRIYIPAFPMAGSEQNAAEWGMELRDYFAGQVIAGFGSTQFRQAPDLLGMARAAYQIADAMMEARK